MNHKFIFLAILGTLFHPSALSAANQDQSVNTEQARKDYRAYLEQLKAISQQYSEITGEMKKFLKEEGVPEWDEATGTIHIKPYTEEPTDTAESHLMQETDKDMTMSLDLPGVDKKSIQVAIQDGQLLHVKARRKIQNKDQTIEKILTLPAPAQEAGTQAKYEDGVLTVRIMKAAKKEVTIPLK